MYHTTTASSTALTTTTATSVFTSTSKVSSTFTGAGPALGQSAGPRRTLAFGFAEPSNSITDQGGHLDIAFIHVLGVGSHMQHRAMIDKICTDVGRVNFVSPTEPDFFAQVALNINKRLREFDWTSNLEALVDAVEKTTEEGYYKDERTNLLDLLTTLLKMSKLLAMGEKIAVLRKPLSKVVRRLDVSLWPEEHTEPALSPRSFKPKKSEKSNKRKKAERDAKKKADSNSSSGNALRRAVKRMSMSFAKGDSNTTSAQEEITPQQLLEQESGKTHGDDWAESSDWWRQNGWLSEEAKSASEHESFGS